jgi:hypothetical protein
MPRTIISKMQEDPLFAKSVANKKDLKPKKKKIKYKKISFKVSIAQKNALDTMCKRQKTTPIRFLKSVINKQTARYKANPAPISYVTENQLQLFDLEPETPSKAKK